MGLVKHISFNNKLCDMAIYSHQYPLCICDTLILSFSCLKYYIAHIIFCGPLCQAFFGGGWGIGLGVEMNFLCTYKLRKKEKKMGKENHYLQS